jgi:hypothetical protein
MSGIYTTGIVLVHIVNLDNGISVITEIFASFREYLSV